MLLTISHHWEELSGHCVYYLGLPQKIGHSVKLKTDNKFNGVDYDISKTYQIQLSKIS